MSVDVVVCCHNIGSFVAHLALCLASAFFPASLHTSKTKNAKAATDHLQKVCDLLAEKDASLAQTARNAPAPVERSSFSDSHDSAATSKKRKSASAGDADATNGDPTGAVEGEGDVRSKKKRASSTLSSSNGIASNATMSSHAGVDMTLSDREERGLEALATFIEERGGKRSLVQNYRCRVTKKPSDGRYDTNFFNEQARRFRSMIEVARYLGLADGSVRTAAGMKTASMKKRTRANNSSGTAKEIEMEKKKLRKELDRLRKQYSRATKNLDDLLADDNDTQFPVEDSLLQDEDIADRVPSEQRSMMASGTKEPPILPTNCAAARVPDIGKFTSLPIRCMPDVLQAWDFLCTFSRTLSLETISLGDFILCLTYMPPQRTTDSDAWKYPPVYLGEAHLSLLKLVLSDQSSDEWWWSILETEQTENAVLATGDAATKEAESDLPLIKIDFGSLLADPEDPLITTSWIQALQPIRSINSTDTGELKEAVAKAMGLVANKWVLAYLRKAIKLGKTSGPSFMKRAVMWLADKVPQAKPELLKRTSSRSSDVLKHRAKLVEDITEQMEKLSSATLTVVEDDLVSDVEEEDSDDESDDENEVVESKASSEASSEDRAASYIPKKPPPSLVDLLLPPGKPIPPSDIFNPPSWPHLAGAAASRIVHRYKRLRNEVDDAVRKSHKLPHLTVKQRRERELISTGRVLSEFAAHNDETGPAERAIEVLCAGGNYLDLAPLQRLAVLRVLIEAAYDTIRVFEQVDSNYKQRANAMKALDNEQRRAKRETKENAAAAEAAARNDLALEARHNFIEEKREEILKLNEANQELTTEEIETLTEQDILDFDDDIKADFEALPTSESFSKAEVVARVAKIQEAAAFETELLTVLNMNELIDRERQELATMEEQFEQLGGEDMLMDPYLDRSTARKIEKLSRDIRKAQDSVGNLPPIREEALVSLREAISDGTIKSLRASIRLAKSAKLFGADVATNGVWALDVVRDAHMELENAKHLKRVADAQKDLISKLNRCFIRTEPLGSDRFRNRFWRFESGDRSHIWVEVNHVLKETNSKLLNEPGFVKVVANDIAEISVGPPDIEEDFTHDLDVEDLENFYAFSRREYHQSGRTASLVKLLWGCQANELSVRALIKGLDSRGMRENSLKKSLKEALEEKSTTVETGTEVKDQEENVERSKPATDTAEDEKGDVEELETCDDEAAFVGAKKASIRSPSEMLETAYLENLSTAIGEKVRVRVVVESTREGEIARYEVASITGWKKKRDNVPLPTDENEFEPQTKVVYTPLWRAWTENGNEHWLSGSDLVECISRHYKWQTRDPDYFEDDAVFLAYRNGLGKQFGKASDAAHAMSPIRFGQFMVKREGELYQRLKMFTFDNNWGGKIGSRNAWITSMRDYAFDFETVRDGLVALENAFFELIGGSLRGSDNVDVASARDLLDNPQTREDIELESIDSSAGGLWNSQESRNVFIEIVTSELNLLQVALVIWS